MVVNNTFQERIIVSIIFILKISKLYYNLIKIIKKILK